MPYREKEHPLTGMLSEFREAIEDEIKTIEKSGQTSTLLRNGRAVKNHLPEYCYQFDVEYTPSLPADTPCKLIVGKDAFDVTVVSFETKKIIVSSKIPLPDAIGKARLENGSIALLKRLIECIEENADQENNVGMCMFPENGNPHPFHRIFTYHDLKLEKNNTPNQNEAITSALSNDITYIWGPPGTGKSKVIGQIIDELYRHKRSVLMVSHTNTAVDGALEKVDKNAPILRLGAPMQKLPRASLKAHVAALGKELYEQKATLEKEQGDLEEKLKAISPLLAKAVWNENSRLEQIKENLHTVAAQTETIRSIENEIERIETEIQQEKEAHPEYIQFLSLPQIIQAKKLDYDDVCEQICQTEKVAHSLPLQIQHAQDEIKKYTVYQELRAQEAKFMSASFLRTELAKTRAEILALNEEISDLKGEQEVAQRTITDHEKKSSFAKLFSRKNTVLQAQAALQDISVRLPQAQEKLQQMSHLETEYHDQLERLLVLQEQIKAVTPSRTQDDWEKELVGLQEELVKTNAALSNLYAEKTSLQQNLCALEQEQLHVKASFDRLHEYEETRRQKQELLENVKRSRDQENNDCSEQLEEECRSCAAFSYDPQAQEPELLFHELYHLFLSVKSELASVDLIALRKEKGRIEDQLAQNARLLNEIKQKMQGLERQAILEAKIIGTTLTKSYLSRTLRERKFDTIILDEASMASIPALWCTSYLAEKNIVIVGDFLQLPPIVMAETPVAKKWLGKDIFYHSGMQECAEEKETCPANFIMLNDQFRMEPDIAEIANIYYGPYGGLRSDPDNPFQEKKRNEFYEWYPGEKNGPNIHLIDTESLHAWVTGVPQGKKHSRLNYFSAAVDVDLAFHLIENKLTEFRQADVTAKEREAPYVLIVAPYKPHVVRLNQLIELEYRNRGFSEDLNLIRAGTVHSFQGSEADIVIFDLVVDEPHFKVNLFMPDIDGNQSLQKMFNVAVTRAMHKLFIVGNFAYCQKKAKNNALSELLDKLLTENQLPKMDAKELLPNLTFSQQTEFSLDHEIGSNHLVCKEGSFDQYFMADIKSFKQRLIIYSPFMTEARLSRLLPAFADAIQAGKQIIVVTKAMSERKKTEVAPYQKCEKGLRDIGVTIIHKRGMHEKLIFIDDDIVWSGSLNALSFTGLTGEFMSRYVDKNLVADCEKQLDLNHFCEAAQNPYEQTCPLCGGEMLLREGDKGGTYWQCINQDYSRNMAQQYPVDGVLRCHCGAPYVFSMKNTPRWVCSANSRHYKNVLESDLKLEKMAALIPTKTARKQVEQYFAKKRKEDTGKTRQRKGKSTPVTAKKNADDIDVGSGDQLKLF